MRPFTDKATLHLPMLEVVDQLPPGTIVTKIIAPIDAGPAFEEHPSYRLWKAGGPEAQAQALAALYEPEFVAKQLAGYGQAAHDAVERGVTINRVVLVNNKRRFAEGLLGWREWWIQLLCPYIASQTGETIRLLSTGTCSHHRTMLQSYDVTAFGQTQIMRTYYAPGGELSRRYFYEPPDDTRLVNLGYRYTQQVWRLAVDHGMLLNPLTPPTSA